MDLDSRPHHHQHHRRTATAELFICFTSRHSSSLSSSSMKLSKSKSILSPGRARDPPFSLSTSLSRRLRRNATVKGGGGQSSPMFPTTGKKRGSALENPEPSSPKVTCIGQVRVKTKKKVKNSRSLSRRRSGGEVSFRKLGQASDGLNQGDEKLSFQNNRYSQECVPHRNQRWVHLPLTICEALKAFGSEFSCLFPCRSSSCFSTSNRAKEEKLNEQRSCGGDVCARWFVTLQDGEEEEEAGKRREIEMVVANEEDEITPARQSSTMRSSRRHMFEDFEFNDDERGDEVKARSSLCIPPKNALLLMRCRSDPAKMASLTDRFWGSPASKDEDEESSENEQVELRDTQKCELNNEVELSDDSVDLDGIEENPEAVSVIEVESESMELENHVDNLENGEVVTETEQEDKEEECEINQFVTEIVDSGEQLAETLPNQTTDSIEHNRIEEPEEEADVLLPKEATFEEEDEVHFKSIIEAQIQELLLLGQNDKNQTLTQQEFEPEIAKQPHKEDDEDDEEEDEYSDTSIAEPEKKTEPQNEEKKPVLPECLLLMMCEPKLSMEVSKETWVCTTDFIRCLPERKQVQPAGKKQVHEEPKRRRSTDSRPTHLAHDSKSHRLLQPPRSSCSFPVSGAGGVAGMSMATMIEQKLVNAAAYEPLVLTRCKSEPMRKPANLAPDTCFWKNKKIEPHPRATAGVGF